MGESDSSVTKEQTCQTFWYHACVKNDFRNIGQIRMTKYGSNCTSIGINFIGSMLLLGM